jgi:hypothetical protein
VNGLAFFHNDDTHRYAGSEDGDWSDAEDNHPDCHCSVVIMDGEEEEEPVGPDWDHSGDEALDGEQEEDSISGDYGEGDATSERQGEALRGDQTSPEAGPGDYSGATGKPEAGPWDRADATLSCIETALSMWPDLRRIDPYARVAPTGPWTMGDPHAREVARRVVRLMWDHAGETRFSAAAMVMNSLEDCLSPRQEYAVLLIRAGCLPALSCILRSMVDGADIQFVITSLISLLTDALCEPGDASDVVPSGRVNPAREALARFCADCLQPGVASAVVRVTDGKDFWIAEQACHSIALLSKEQPGILKGFVAAGGVQLITGCLAHEHPGMVGKAAAVGETVFVLCSSPLTAPFLERAAAGGVLEWLVSLLAPGPEDGRAPPAVCAARALQTPDSITQPALAAVLTLAKAPANARRLVRMRAAMDWFLAALDQAGLCVPAQVRAAQSQFLAEGAVQGGSAHVALPHAPPSPAADDGGETEGEANPAPPVDEGGTEVEVNPGPHVDEGDAEGAVSPAAPPEADAAAPKADPAAAPDTHTAAAHKADIPAGPEADNAAPPEADTAAGPKVDAAAHEADPAAGVIPSGGVFPTTPEKGEGVRRRGRTHRADPTAGVFPTAPDEARADAGVTPTGIDEASTDAGVLSTSPDQACADAVVGGTALRDAPRKTHISIKLVCPYLQGLRKIVISITRAGPCLQLL